MYITKESRKSAILKGKPVAATDVDVSEWVEDIHSYFVARPMNDSQKVDYIMDHAKWEVKLRPEAERTSPDMILEIIFNVFREPDSDVRKILQKDAEQGGNHS